MKTVKHEKSIKKAVTSIHAIQRLKNTRAKMALRSNSIATDHELYKINEDEENDLIIEENMSDNETDEIRTELSSPHFRKDRSEVKF